MNNGSIEKKTHRSIPLKDPYTEGDFENTKVEVVTSIPLRLILPPEGLTKKDYPTNMGIRYVSNWGRRPFRIALPVPRVSVTE